LNFVYDVDESFITENENLQNGDNADNMKSSLGLSTQKNHLIMIIILIFVLLLPILVFILFKFCSLRRIIRNLWRRLRNESNRTQETFIWDSDENVNHLGIPIRNLMPTVLVETQNGPGIETTEFSVKNEVKKEEIISEDFDTPSETVSIQPKSGELLNIKFMFV
jgi:hypothetical protein